MSIATGVRAFSSGLRVSRQPALARYVWLPMLVSFIVCVLGLYLTLGYLTARMDVWLAGLPDWLSWLSLLLTPLVYITGVLAGAWLIAFIAVLLVSPFLGPFSRAVEERLYAEVPIPETTLASEAIQALGREVRKLVYHLPRALLVFVLTLVPGINVAAPALWLLFGAWTLAVQFADYPAENRGQPFRETLSRLKTDRAAALGFGLCASAALAVPLANFLFVPVAVAGGTILWRELGKGDEGAPQP